LPSEKRENAHKNSGKNKTIFSLWLRWWRPDCSVPFLSHHSPTTSKIKIKQKRENLHVWMNNRKSAIALYRAQPRFSLFSNRIITGDQRHWHSLEITRLYFVCST
jgi:hypothetical protein